MMWGRTEAIGVARSIKAALKRDYGFDLPADSDVNMLVYNGLMAALLKKVDKKYAGDVAVRDAKREHARDLLGLWVETCREGRVKDSNVPKNNANSGSAVALSWRWFIFGSLFCLVAFGFAAWGFYRRTLTEHDLLILRWVLPLASGMAFGAIGGSLSVKTRQLIPMAVVSASGGAAVWLLTAFVIFPGTTPGTFGVTVFVRAPDGILLNVQGKILFEFAPVQNYGIEGGVALAPALPSKYIGKEVGIQVSISGYQQVKIPFKSILVAGGEINITCTNIPDPGLPVSVKHLPKIVAMDSSLLTFSTNGGRLNADEISDVLKDRYGQPVKESTNLHWDRHEFVRKLDPDLIIIHLSAFCDKTIANSESDAAMQAFVEYMSKSKAQFLFYSRGLCFSNDTSLGAVERLNSRHFQENKMAENISRATGCPRDRTHVFMFPSGTEKNFTNKTVRDALLSEVVSILD